MESVSSFCPIILSMESVSFSLSGPVTTLNFFWIFVWMEVPSEKEVIQYISDLSNWGKWGLEDELGTINYITPQLRLEALGIVKENNHWNGKFWRWNAAYRFHAREESNSFLEVKMWWFKVDSEEPISFFPKATRYMLESGLGRDNDDGKNL